MDRRDRRRERKAKQRRERIRLDQHHRRAQPQQRYDEPQQRYDEPLGDDGPLESLWSDRPSAGRQGPLIQRNVHHVPGGVMIDTERSQRAMSWLLRTDPPRDEADLQDRLAASYQGHAWLALHARMLAADPQEAAQELAFQALEAAARADAPACRAAAEAALAGDPGCADAHLALALQEPEAAARLERLTLAISGEEERLGGPAFIEENRGHFWRIVATRPVMRLRLHRLRALQALDRLPEAVAEAETLLELNADDAQAVRFHLLACLLALGDTARAATALNTHRDEADAAWCWAQVLYVLRVDVIRESEDVVERAVTANAFVPLALLAVLAAPDGEAPACPPQYEGGEPSEARYIADVFARAWLAHPPAVAWLQLIADGLGSA